MRKISTSQKYRNFKNRVNNSKKESKMRYGIMDRSGKAYQLTDDGVTVWLPSHLYAEATTFATPTEARKVRNEINENTPRSCNICLA